MRTIIGAALAFTAGLALAQSAAAQQPRTASEAAECVISEAAYYKHQMARAYGDKDNDALGRLMTDAAATAIAARCGVHHVQNQ
jgi:hypothetical protein